MKHFVRKAAVLGVLAAQVAAISCKPAVKPNVENPRTITVADITVDPNVLNLVIGERTTLTATVTPKNATYNRVSWESDNPDIATVE